MAHNPTRSRSSLRRGVLHNARELDDGRWAWRYDKIGDRLDDLDDRFADLWEAMSDVPAPILLVQGGLSPVVDDDDIAELQRRRPDAEVAGGRRRRPQRAGRPADRAGPHPRADLTVGARPEPSADQLDEPIDLVGVGAGRHEQQLVAAGLLEPVDGLADAVGRPGRAEVGHRARRSSSPKMAR